MLATACRRYGTAALPTALIPKTGKNVTRLGFGAYRLSTEEHADALQFAIRNGINVIDTASNFEQGKSETLIGSTLKKMTNAGELDRNQLVLMSKGGYLSASEAAEYDASRDYVQISEKQFHTLSPRVIERQLEQSLERLGTDHIDVFMINAPERMLMARNRRYTMNDVYQELTDCFHHLDQYVQTGVLGGYGICSNTMGFPDAADHVSLSHVMHSISHPSHLVALQAPLNWFEPEIVHGHAGQPSLSTEAEQHDLYLFSHRPLTAIAQGQVRLLVNQSGENEACIMDKMTQAFQRVTWLETNVTSELPFREEGEDLITKFVWGQVLSENLQRLAQNHFATRHYLSNQVMPAVNKDLDALQDYAAGLEPESEQEAFLVWMNEYRQAMAVLMDTIVSYAYIDTLRKNDDLSRIVDALCPTLGKDIDHAHSRLSVMALRFLLSQQGVGTVLTGMRQRAYVQDAILAAQLHHNNPPDSMAMQTLWRCPVFHTPATPISHISR